MEKKSRKVLLIKTLLIGLAFITTFLLVSLNTYKNNGYNLEVGSVSPYKIQAPEKIENTVATEDNKELAQRAADDMAPVTEHDYTVDSDVTAKLDDFFAEVDKARSEQSGSVNEATSSANENQTSGLSSETPDSTVFGPVSLNNSSTSYILNMSTSDYSNFKNTVYSATNAILKAGVPDLDSKTLLSLKDYIDSLDLNSDEKSLAYDVIYSCLEPNIIVDEKATTQAKNERAEDYETVYYQKNQTIVDSGDIVTNEDYAALESLGLINTGNINFYVLAGSLLLLLVIFITSWVYLRNYSNKNFGIKETVLMFCLYLILILCISFMVNYEFYLLPILLFTIIVALIFGDEVAILYNTVVSIVCFLIHDGEMEYLTFFLLTGLIVVLFARYLRTHRGVIFPSLGMALSYGLVYLGVSLFFGQALWQDLVVGFVICLIYGVLTVAIGISIAPMIESIFGIGIPFRLLDLTRPDNALMRRLAIEAPGTYHHSVVVANLAETAAIEIGAEHIVTRTGAYFHDIGKLKYPQYFTENLSGESAEGLSNEEYVAIIKEHVTYGLILADENKLPSVIKDFIEQHHGSTLLKFFYYKEIEEKPDEMINEDDFRYHGRIPQSRETAIVMLADTLEAAVRSMSPQGKSISEIEKRVDELIKDKLEDGQLLDSGLTIKDLKKIKESFMIVFKGMYHKRIPYPVENKKETVKPAIGTEEVEDGK